jgi:hypothetical protein
MPNLIGLGASVGATALAVALGAAFWPQAMTSPISAKSVISQPIFVNAPAPKTPSAATLVSAATTIPRASDDASALAKLAVALRADPSAALKPTTRSMTLVAASSSAPPLASEAARRFCAQGLVALAAGDIVSARLYLERAAEIGDVRALMVLGESYDPAALARMGAVGIKGDPAKARGYYSRALAAGMGAARERMAALDAP